MEKAIVFSRWFLGFYQIEIFPKNDGQRKLMLPA